MIYFVNLSPFKITQLKILKTFIIILKLMILFLPLPLLCIV